MAIFDDELMQLKEKIVKMGSMVEEAIRNSIRALVERDDSPAKSVIEKDHIINTLDVEIDEECIRLIALRQTKARDLRFITTAMKITTDLERMGDLAVSIAGMAIELNQVPLLKPYVNIPKMAEITQEMVRNSLDALVKGCTILPYEVIKRDDEVDELTEINFKELLNLMLKDRDIIQIALKRTYVAKALERIADHATNIAEMVIYLCEGKIIRHTAPYPKGH